MEENNLIKETSAAHGAKSVLDNPTLVEAFNTLEEIYIQRWVGSQDKQAREEFWLAVNVVRDVQNHLKSLVENGKKAEKDLQEIRQIRKHKRKFSFF